MFTGIIQDVGQLHSLEARGGDLRLTIDAQRLPLQQARPGDSIAVNGVCLTAVQLEGPRFAADVSRETLTLTTLGSLAPGDAVNLEPALRAGDALGGHLVSGHVDGVGEVLTIVADGRSWRMRFRVPPGLARYFARKGSVTVDGVSLTVNEVERDEFGVNLVPHTLEVTTLGSFKAGRRVNLEVDPIARYVERLMLAAAEGA